MSCPSSSSYIIHSSTLLSVTDYSQFLCFICPLTNLPIFFFFGFSFSLRSLCYSLYFTLWIFKDNFTICDWFSLSHTKTQPTQSRVCVHNHHQRSSNTQKVSNFPFHWFIYLHSMLNKSKIIASFPPHLSPSSQPHQNQICIVDLAMAELRAPELIGFKRRLVVQCIVTALFPFFLYCEILAWKR